MMTKIEYKRFDFCVELYIEGVERELTLRTLRVCTEAQYDVVF
jgi:hypothetical protein